jgi:hypothetical protein
MIIHVFPDLEASLIRQLTDRLALLGYTNVRVGAVKSEGDSPQPDAQVIVGDDGGNLINAALREHGFRINIWAKDWATASSLARHVEAIVPTLPHHSAGAIKYATVDGSATRVEDPTGEEMRTLSGTAIIRSVTQTI